MFRARVGKDKILSAKQALAAFLKAVPLSVKEDKVIGAYVDQLQQRQDGFYNISLERVARVSYNLKEISKRCHLGAVPLFSNKDQLNDNCYVQDDICQIPRAFYFKTNKADVTNLDKKYLMKCWRIAVLEMLVLMLGLEAKASLDYLEQVQKEAAFNIIAESIKKLKQKVELDTPSNRAYIYDAVNYPRNFQLKSDKKLKENEALLLEKISALNEMNTDLNVIITALKDPTDGNLEAFTERANLHKERKYDFGCCKSYMMGMAPVFALVALAFLAAGVLVACPLVGIPLAASLTAFVGTGAGMAGIYGVTALVFGVSSGLMFYKGYRNEYELTDAGSAMMDTAEAIKSNKSTLYSAN